MKLFYRKTGEGPPLIIVHGLYGSSDNWMSVGKALSSQFEVFMIDQRNHGQSPHSSTHDYESMKNDLLEFMHDQQIEKAVLVGHSMGGKTVMNLAVSFPEKMNAMIVIDIAPKSYLDLTELSSQAIDHLNIINAMENVNLGKLANREDADNQLALVIHSPRIRKFLLKNIDRAEDGRYFWKINLGTLKTELPKILEGLDEKKISMREEITGFPVLFIRGEKSSYILDEDFQSIRKIFPQSEFVTIPGAGHWLHAEKPELLVKTLKYFLL